MRNEATASARAQSLQVREEAEREIQRRREEFDRLERRTEERARGLDEKLEKAAVRDREFSRREEGVTKRESELREREEAIARLVQEQQVIEHRGIGHDHRDREERHLLTGQGDDGERVVVELLGLRLPVLLCRRPPAAHGKRQG